jgi:parallel beta-helix repeat protein
VATSGNDASSGSVDAPFGSLGHGVGVLTPGDTLCVRGGTYAETLDDAIPSGTSWSAPVTVAAYPGESVTIRPNAGADFGLHFVSDHHVVVSGVIVDATNVTYDAVKVTSGSAGAAHHIRIERSEIMNAPGQGILVTGNDQGVQYNEFRGLKVHGNGAVCAGFATRDFCHGFYIATSYNVVDGSEIYGNAGWGVQVYQGTANQANGNVVSNNRIHDNAAAGYRGPGIVLSSGVGNTAFNNVVWGNNGGIEVAYAVSDAKVFNNTIYANNANPAYNALHDDPAGISTADCSGVQVTNNVIFGTTADVHDYGACLTLTTNLTSDPGFVNAAGLDFHVASGSPAIDTGTTLGEVPVDADGTPRPQGAAYDIGAYER